MTSIKTLLLFALSTGFSASLFAQWTEVTPMLRWKYNGFDALSADTAFVAGWDFVHPFALLKTIDGARHWEKITVPDPFNSPAFELPVPRFLDAQTGFLLCSLNDDTPSFDRAVLLRTPDGGHTWVNVSPAIPDSGAFKFEYRHSDLRFCDSQRGVLFTHVFNAGTRIRTTDDGGLSWNLQTNCPMPLEHLRMFPDGSGHANLEGNPEAIWTTADFGHTWVQLDPAVVTERWHFYRQGVLYQEEFYYTEKDGYKQIEKSFPQTGFSLFSLESTSDDGNSWSPETIRTVSIYPAELIVKDNVSWLVGIDQIYRRLNKAPVQALDPGAGLKFIPNLTTSYDWVRIQEPHGITGVGELRLIHLESGLELYRIPAYSNAGRILFQVPDLPHRGYCLALFYFAGDMKSGGKLYIR